MKQKRRPKLPTPSERVSNVGSRYVGAALTGKLDELPATVVKEWHAAHVAREAGAKRQQRKAGKDWRPVFEYAVAIDRAVFNTPIIKKRVQAVLTPVSPQQTRDMKLAAHSQYGAFIKWVRRGLTSGALTLPPPPPPAMFASTAEDSD